MYQELSEIATKVMEETGLRFSDVAQLCEKLMQTATETADQDGKVSIAIVQQKTKYPVRVRVSVSHVRELIKCLMSGYEMSDLKYTTYRNYCKRNGLVCRRENAKNDTIAHAGRHRKAHEIGKAYKEEQAAKAAIAVQLGVKLKTATTYQTSKLSTKKKQ